MVREPPSDEAIERHIRRVGQYSRFVRAGLAVVVLAFLLAVVRVVPATPDRVAATFATLQQPLTFVGVALILYGIGMHLHLLHLNVVRQLGAGEEPSSDRDERPAPSRDDASPGPERED